jgi:type IV secretion system protein VirB9
MRRPSEICVLALLLSGAPWVCLSDEPAVDGQRHPDSRIRTMLYDADQVYRLRGYVGYQIDLEFERGESFVGLGAGDVDGLGFAAQDNHLFIKPKAVKVRTNLTVLTTRRSYHFDYEVISPAGPERFAPQLIYTLRFTYPAAPPSPASAAVAEADAARNLERAAGAVPANRDYWFCGSPALLPLAAFDDGVHTHLRFNPREELPAVFVRNEDGTESLLNFSVQQGELVIHRVAAKFVVRRGKLQGCIVNKGFEGTGRELQSGTVTSEVERATRAPAP